MKSGEDDLRDRSRPITKPRRPYTAPAIRQQENFETVATIGCNFLVKGCNGGNASTS
jgi:hypothetical protein